MKYTNYTVIVLEPSEGYLITQVADVPTEDRIFSDKVFLAINDLPENWKEISIDEANKNTIGTTN